jgi:hypothetical protein
MRALKAHKAHATGTGKVAGADKTANADKMAKDAGKRPKFRRKYLVRPDDISTRGIPIQAFPID